MNAVSITVQQFSKIYQGSEKPFILDVREPWEVKKVSLKGAINIPLSFIDEQKDKLPQNQPIYVICHHGVRSLKVAFFLRDQGYEAFSLIGGLDDWARNIDSSIGFY